MRLQKMLAKSSPPEPLTAHLEATLVGAEALRRRVGMISVAESVTQGMFWQAACLAALCHDAGKIPDGFQAMLAGRVRSWGERHEVVSLGFLPALLSDGLLLLWTATGVVTHHRHLEGGRGPLAPSYGGASETEWRDRLLPIPEKAATELVDWLADTARRAGLPVTVPQNGELDVIGEAWRVFGQVLDRWEQPVSMEEGVAAVLLQGAVTLADHLSSAHGVLHTRQPLDDGFPTLLAKTFADKGHTIRPHQRQAADVDGHLLLRAPTGSGKTEAGLLWAATQVELISRRTGGIPRVFYTLPYLASINAMAVRLGRLLGDEDLVGVMHSRAASYHLAKAVCPEDDDEKHVEAARKAVSRAAATRLFRETLRVGTPYQILRGALAGPAHSSMLIDAANSVFVLDELHAYDPQRLGYILAMAGMWERLGGRVAVLSATLPDALAELFRDVLDGSIRLVQANTAGDPRRHRLALRNARLTDPRSLEEIAERLDRNESVLVVANNVADAQYLFHELSPQAEVAYLLHSRFRRMDRSTLEREISERFGVGQPRRPGLVVATQVVEVSLDVDFDCLFTAAAPLEALLQRFGRVNRIASRPPADVVVHPASYAPRRRNGGKGEEYADGVYHRPPVETGWAILARHDGQAVDEGEARTWLDEVYGTAWGREWREEVMRNVAVFTDAFLSFAHPFTGRDDLADHFDRLFDGTEAILIRDRDAYEADLGRVNGSKAAGRLLAERYLIPMPYWAAPLTSWEKRLGVRVVDADYDERLGLGEIRKAGVPAYQAGEVL
ncbi:CRISPR-associated helicase/endonuclease Cas3 [Thermostaphylospora chromogena]|uniref:CRISPR-associated helicase, Cas3 family n=1 Tax=Thermostaphylospora chromogena TaxID=35622 RepID=A0A1H1HDR4_9ACTN|nr:CRISPR-associated helicase/endonuclease Cas3 [Thermostaphylospora chromogena]SDR23590.1 CRISPR-associated helicase, Cas3 family [Thermostaphylospora chromogena]